MWSRVWPHVRAVLVALHVVAVTVLALPVPDGVQDRATWQQPTVRQEMRDWADALNAVGFETTPEVLEDRLWHLAHGYATARDSVLAPFGPYYEYCGTFQGWRMFSGPQMFPATLHIDISEAGAWRPVFVERDRRYGWLARELDSYRFRALRFRMQSSVGFEGDYELFARWVAVRAANDFPTADRVRVRLFRYRLQTPAEVQAATPVFGQFEQEIVLPLRGTP
jgi:hypothetical protein